MLKYLGDLLETVMMPKIVVGELNKFATGSRCWRGWACKPCPPRGANAEQKLDDAGQTAVKLLKGNGLSEVVAQFTHIGMVVYHRRPSMQFQRVPRNTSISSASRQGKHRRGARRQRREVQRASRRSGKLRQVARCRALRLLLQVPTSLLASELAKAPSPSTLQAKGTRYGWSCGPGIGGIGMET